MDREVRKAVTQAVGVLSEAFNRKASEATFGAYEIGLGDLSVDQIKLAMTRAIRECRFMPSPAELRELAGELAGEGKALHAWNEFLKHVPIGAYSHVDFTIDPIINATIRTLGGWPNVLSRLDSAENEKWLQKDFVRTYQSLNTARVTGEVCDPLPGLSTGSVKVIDGERIMCQPRIVCIEGSGTKRIEGKPNHWRPTVSIKKIS